ncbi:MAG: hypothetical protein Q8M11_02005 [Sulfuritalea sp.]|nr:hypothetical protein [Sulfuritalea sp.]MDP1980947.1 hypothetical protein [Sulfuritalea sp.]
MRPAIRHISGLLGLALLATAHPATAQELGRLFFTPERRAAMERQRTYNIQEAQTLQGTTMSLDGVVHRSSGKTTVWINRAPQTESDAMRTGVSAVTSPKAPGSALLSPGDEAPSRLNVGETINRTTGERNTRLGGGAVVTHGKRNQPR